MSLERLHDAEWQLLKRLVTTGEIQRGRPPTKHRQIFDAIFWIAENRQPWRSLPQELGKWNTVYRQFKRWSDMNLWQVVLEDLDLVSSDLPVASRMKQKALAAKILAEKGRDAESLPSSRQKSRGKVLEEGSANI